MEQFLTDNGTIIVALLAAVLSETIGISKAKSNSLLQLLYNIYKSKKGGK